MNNAWDDCSNRKNHTRQPEGYLQYVEWAEKKGKTHKQIKCDVCGLYKIWVKFDPPGDPNE